MLLVQRVLDWGPAQATVAATPQAEAWYAEQGAMPAWMGIELIAQAIAAHVGLLARLQGKPPRKGLLLGTREYRATLPRFAAGAELRVTALQCFIDASGLGSYHGSIRLAEAEVASASVTVFEPPDFDAFLAQAVGR
jgi:predicted hotdog family 3-hydroxylacyl-ACP dehydratase